ncbi:MAG: ribose 5-phosphate isomerase B [Candidatus Puniceispirillum sp.]|nr:ribose 5-phosphate isomerase B [Candidatus Puniceispirillum sp.]
MEIFIGCDHAGFTLKEALGEVLASFGTVHDLGTKSEGRVDYPDFSKRVCESVLGTPESFGILICGTGIGMSIAANRFRGIRAALCNDAGFCAHFARAHNNANILCLGGRLVTPDVAMESVRVFFTTSFEQGRHAGRVTKIETCAFGENA